MYSWLCHANRAADSIHPWCTHSKAFPGRCWRSWLDQGCKVYSPCAYNKVSLTGCNGSAALPHLRINPTSGVTEESAQSFLANGAFSLGFVACLFDAKGASRGLSGHLTSCLSLARCVVDRVWCTDMSERNFDAIGARAAQMVQQAETAPRPAKGPKAKL